MWSLWVAIMAASPAPGVDGGLPLADVRDLIGWHSAEINACLDGGVKGGTVRYRFTINPAGTVGHLSFLEARRVESPRITCVGTALETWRFPAADAGTIVEWPFARASFDAGILPVPEALEPEAVDLSWWGDASRCYDASHPSQGQEGRLSLELVVSRSGVIVAGKAARIDPGLAASSLPSCLEGASSAWSLKSSSAPRRVLTEWIFGKSYERTKQFGPTEHAMEIVELAFPGGRDKEVIEKEITRWSPDIRGCYEVGLRARPALSGMFTVAFQIGVDGRVITPRAKEDELKDEVTTGCIIRIVEGMVFPPPSGGGVVNVTFPWIFRTEER